jgi:hypothetical protein
MPFFSARPTSNFSVRAKRGVLPFLTRQVLTTGYVAAGYKDTVTWRNINSINNATDTTTNHGDLLGKGGSYIAGVHDKNNGFLFGTNGSGTEGWGAFNGSSCFNMRNNTTLTNTAGMNPYSTVGSSFGMMNHNNDGNADFGWYTGTHSSNFVAKFSFATQVHVGQPSTTMPNVAGSDTGGGTAGFMAENFGVWHNDGTNKVKFTFANETEATYGVYASVHSQQKVMSSKVGFAWGGNEGSYNAGNNFRKTNTTTETTTGTMTKPITDSGEENFTMGQAHAYCLGFYNTAGQNNRSYRWNYATDAGFEGGASMQPTGTASGTGASGTCCPSGQIGGRSSGVGMWRD